MSVPPRQRIYGAFLCLRPGGPFHSVVIIHRHYEKQLVKVVHFQGLLNRRLTQGEGLRSPFIR